MVPICWGIVIRDGRRQFLGGAAVDSVAADSAAVCRLPSAVSSFPFAVYCTAYLFWLASVWWVSHPYPPFTTIGLFALAAVLSLFWVLFFVSARVAVHRYNIPLLVAMPLCWLGTEYIRCRILGGFSFCALEHAFYLYPPLIQFASIGGGLLVGGIIMFLGAALLTLCQLCISIVSFAAKIHKHEDFTEDAIKKYQSTGNSALSACCFLLFLFLAWIAMSLQEYNPSDNLTSYSIVALQGNRQVYIDGGQEEADKTFAQFVHLAYQEIDDRKQAGVPLPDLIVFPETVCPIPVLVFEGMVTPADFGWTEEQATHWERDFRRFAQSIQTPVLLGLSTLVFADTTSDPIRLNSALFVKPSLVSAPSGEGDSPPLPEGKEPEPPTKMYRYDKMHLVLFGEYVPLAEYLPSNFILRTLCHEARHGMVPLAIPIGYGNEEKETIDAAVNICFESSVAHLIRQQILTLRKWGHDPRMLINLSNDGWFRNSHAMEQHLATHVFRAVENRMYYVTATNGGFSAIISPYGKIRNIGERPSDKAGAEAVSGEVSVNVNMPQCTTIYQIVGDGYALPLAVGVLILTGIGWRERRKRP